MPTDGPPSVPTDGPPTVRDAGPATDRADGEPVAPGVYRRPARYEPSFPVVRWLADVDCAIGNRFAAHSSTHDQHFEHVLTLTSEPQPGTTHHRPMVDDYDCEWSAFAAAVDVARDLLDREGSLLVHCRCGISRSSAVLGTALAARRGEAFHDGVAVVQAARPHAAPHPEFYRLGTVYLAARADGDPTARAGRDHTERA